MRVTTFCYNSFTTKQKTKGAVTLMSIVTLLNTLVEELNSAEEMLFLITHTLDLRRTVHITI